MLVKFIDNGRANSGIASASDAFALVRRGKVFMNTSNHGIQNPQS